VDKSKATPEEVHNAFLGTLAKLHRGRTITELTEAEESLVAAIRKTGKPGTILLKVRIKPHGKDSDMMMLNASVEVKLPQPQRSDTIMFADDENRLQRNDPRQLEDQRLIAVPKEQPIADTAVQATAQQRKTA
jgi:hypothetical protein